MALTLFPRFGSFFDDIEASGFVGPAVHFRESRDQLVLELEVPRYRFDEIRVEVRDQHLIVTGNRRSDSTRVNDDQFLYGEAPMSHFRRAIYVPPSWDLSKVTHELNYGVLQITVPRAQQQPLPPREKLTIGGQGAQSTSNNQLIATTDKSGLQVTSTSKPEEYNAVANLKWPPKIKVDNAEDHLTYSANMPPTLGKDHIDLSLQGNHLNLGVHHQRNVIKKDTSGNVVFSQDQSVSYSTNLLVPEGTKASDISTNYTDGNLSITIAKHRNGDSPKDQQQTRQLPVKGH